MRTSSHAIPPQTKNERSATVDKKRRPFPLPRPRSIPCVDSPAKVNTSFFLRENQGGGLFSAEYRTEEQSLTMRHLKGDRGCLAAAEAFSPQGQDFSFFALKLGGQWRSALGLSDLFAGEIKEWKVSCAFKVPVFGAEESSYFPCIGWMNIKISDLHQFVSQIFGDSNSCFGDSKPVKIWA